MSSLFGSISIVLQNPVIRVGGPRTVRCDYALLCDSHALVASWLA